MNRCKGWDEIVWKQRCMKLTVENGVPFIEEKQSALRMLHKSGRSEGKRPKDINREDTIENVKYVGT